MVKHHGRPAAEVRLARYTQFRGIPSQAQAAILGLEWPLVAGWKAQVKALRISLETHAALVAARTPRQQWQASEYTRVSPAVRRLIWLLAAMRGEPLKGAVSNHSARDLYGLMQNRLGAPAPASKSELVSELILRHLDKLTYRRLPCQDFNPELEAGARALVMEIEAYGRLLSPSELENEATMRDLRDAYQAATALTQASAEAKDVVSSTGTPAATEAPPEPMPETSALCPAMALGAVTIPSSERAPTAVPAHQVALQQLRERCSQEIRVQGEQTTIPEGFIYLVTHPQFEGWVKAGMTIDYEQRLATYNVADPLSRFELTAVHWVAHRRVRERRLLRGLAAVAEEQRGEWFKIELPIAVAEFERQSALAHSAR